MPVACGGVLTVGLWKGRFFMTEKFVEKKSVKRRIYDYVMITAAACIYGVSISLFLDPNNLAPGGVTGYCGDHKTVCPDFPPVPACC